MRGIPGKIDLSKSIKKTDEEYFPLIKNIAYNNSEYGNI